MDIVMPIPLARDDIRANLLRTRILLEEAKELEMLFELRIKEILAEKQVKRAKWVEMGLIFSFEQLSDENTDIRANLYFKCYLFVARQLLDRGMRLLFQLKPYLETPKAAHTFPDPSRPGKFPKFIGGLLAGDYEIDQEVMTFLIENRDFFIISRIWKRQVESGEVSPGNRW